VQRPEVRQGDFHRTDTLHEGFGIERNNPIGLLLLSESIFSEI
jgi:hypothetical protein